jgi:hypothetical protein
VASRHRRPGAARARLALVAALVSVVATAAPATGAAAASTDPGPYARLGAWVSVFDYVPPFVHQLPPPVVPATVDDLAALGARTLYLQAAIDDPRAPDLVVDTGLVSAMLRRAHARGLRVVAWYYPQLVDPTRDQARLEALLRFRAAGQRFDGLALDIESQQVSDVADRNGRLVALVRRLRSVAGSRPIGAIVYPAALLEVVNPRLWPGFPYRALASSVDVWLPMTYWSFRTGLYRDAFVYTDDSIRRLRRDLHDERALVAPIGGLADSSTTADYEGFARAARTDRAVGRSVFDVTATSTAAWSYLRRP